MTMTNKKKPFKTKINVLSLQTKTKKLFSVFFFLFCFWLQNEALNLVRKSTKSINVLHIEHCIFDRIVVAQVQNDKSILKQDPQQKKWKCFLFVVHPHYLYKSELSVLIYRIFFFFKLTAFRDLNRRSKLAIPYGYMTKNVLIFCWGACIWKAIKVAKKANLCFKHFCISFEKHFCHFIGLHLYLF